MSDLSVPVDDHRCLQFQPLWWVAVELDLRPAWAVQLTLSLEKSVGTISNHISMLLLLPGRKMTLTCILSQFSCYGELLKVRRFQLLLFTCVSKEGQVLRKLQPLLSHPIPLITKHTWILDRKGPACYAVHLAWLSTHVYVHVPWSHCTAMSYGRNESPDLHFTFCLSYLNGT